MNKLIRANYESSAAYDAACEADEAVSRIDVVAEIRLYTTGNRQSAIDYSHTIVPHASLDLWADLIERLEVRVKELEANNVNNPCLLCERDIVEGSGYKFQDGGGGSICDACVVISENRRH